MAESSNTQNANYGIGNYVIGDFIGQGGFGKVYKAQHIHLDKQVCIKIVQSDFLSENLKDALWREAQILQALDHKNIVRLHDLTIEDNQIYMFIDYVDGGDLAAILENAEGPLPLNEIDQIIQQIADGLHYAHQKHIIHRDLKPHNILRYKDGRVVIADFGLAKVIDVARVQISLPNFSIIAGTPAYMAPEQFEGQADYSSDLYSLGVIAYHLLAGRPPFGSGLEAQEGHCHESPPPLHDFNANLSPAIERVILKILAKEPHERYQNPVEFASALHSAIQEQILKQAIKVANVKPEKALRRNRARLAVSHYWRRWLVAAIIVCVALLLIPYGYSFYTRSLPVRSHSAKHGTLVPSLSPTPAKVIVIPPPTVSPTSGSRAKATATFSVSSSAPTPGTQVTQTPVISLPTATPVPNNPPGFASPPGWQQVLNNSLTSAGPNASDWASNDPDCNFLANGYQNQKKGSDYCSYGQNGVHSFTDVAYSVQVTITQGNQAGLVFHLLSDNYYAFDISTDGTYVVTRHSSTGGGSDQVLLGPTFSGAITQGLNQENTLAVISKGNSFQFWINNQPVATTSDTTDPSGTIGTGLNAYNNNQVNTIAFFLNALVWTPA